MKYSNRFLLLLFICVICFGAFGVVCAEENLDSTQEILTEKDFELIKEDSVKIDNTKNTLQEPEVQTQVTKEDEIVTYTVTFVISNKKQEVVMVEEGQCVPRPPDPKLPQNANDKMYYFIGWYDDSRQEFDFNTPITQDVTLYAVIGVICVHHVVFEIAFDSTGGSKVSSQSVMMGGLIKKPKDPIKPGYYFLGWYTEEGEKWDFSKAPTSHMTLYAHWTKNDPSPATSDPCKPWFLMLLLCGAAAVGTFVYQGKSNTLKEKSK